MQAFLPELLDPRFPIRFNKLEITEAAFVEEAKQGKLPKNRKKLNTKCLDMFFFSFFGGCYSFFFTRNLYPIKKEMQWLIFLKIFVMYCLRPNVFFFCFSIFSVFLFFFFFFINPL